jgi:DNA recombination protein RmuC
MAHWGEMTMDLYLPWIVATLAIISAAIVLIFALTAFKRYRVEAEALRSKSNKDESLIADLREKSARLPDTTERAIRAENESSARLKRLDELSVANAALVANEQANQKSLTNLEADLSVERATTSELRVALEQTKSRLSNAEADMRSAKTLLEEFRDENARLKTVNAGLQSNLTEALQKSAQAQAERDAARSLHERTQQFLADAQTTLKVSFTEAASKVFDEKSISLEKKIADSTETSKAGLQSTLQPFAESVMEFKQRLEVITTENSKARSELTGKIDTLVTLNQNMADAADSLTKALKGNAKVRGDWGEMVLESVLAASGLQEGINYIRQPSERDEETGNKQRPDVVVELPDSRKVILDSKVNLVAWADAVNTEDSVIEAAALQRHVSALRVHVNQLAERNYPSLYPGEALEITIAFIPIEAALSKALELSPELQREAFRKGIAFATPNTLMAMMQVVERLWVRDKLQKQVATIGNEAAKLLDSISSFLSEFEILEQQFNKTDKQVKAMRSRLESSPQSVLARTKRLIQAGARGKKKLHASLLTAIEDESDTPLINEDARRLLEDQSQEQDSDIQPD